jgi:hypothetical protein
MHCTQRKFLILYVLSKLLHVSALKGRFQEAVSLVDRSVYKYVCDKNYSLHFLMSYLKA